MATKRNTSTMSSNRHQSRIRRRPMPSDGNPAETSQEWLKVSDLRVDHAYQRELNKWRVEDITQTFDPDLLGVLLVSKRSTGTYFLLDGQTRHAALIAMGWEDQRVPCLVYAGLTRKDEARIFVGANVTAVKPNPTAIFKGKLAAGDPATTEVYNIARKYGYLSTLKDFKSGALTSPSALMRIHTKGGADLLDEVLAVTSSAWPGKHVAAPVLTGLAMFIRQYGLAISVERLVQCLAKTTDELLVSRARALAVASRLGNRSASSMIQVLVGEYNARLKTGRLIFTEVHDRDTWRARAVMLLTDTPALSSASG